ncbi:MAG TPA: TIGR00266 family protein [Verrucomicrobiota bacterium]|nr:TIGR00266 family protein [Verrucomicrobiota bacterium]HNU52801.1 TIGR00266 family protein [Verrucomicrobiota bacterium]
MSTVRFEIIQAGDAPVVKAVLANGSSLFADAGAMMAMTPNLTLQSSMKGGLMGALSRKLLRGETFFYLTIKAERGDGEVLLAPATVGGIEILDVSGVEYFLQKGSFLAAADTVEISTKTQNLTQGLFSGEGFFITRVGGAGTLVLNTFGALMKFPLASGQEYVVDNYHLVAWEATTAYTISKAASGWVSSVTSGEGFVCRFKGPGTVYVQTRNPSAFAGWLSGYMPAKG